MADKPTYEELEQRVKELEAESAKHKRAEENLRISEQEKAAILDTMLEHVVYRDTKMRVLWANRAAGESVGLAPQRLVGRHCYEIWHQRSKPCVVCPVKEALKAGQREEVEITTPDERIWWIQAYPVRDANGDILGIANVTLEITERKKAEEVLRESEEFSSSLLTNSPNSTLVINPDTSVRYVNPSLEKLTGFSSSELIGRKAPYPWWTEETLQKTGRDLEEAMANGAQRLEELFQNKNGERFWVEITSTPVRSNGGLKYYLASWMDVTDRKQAEEALRESEERYRRITEAVTDYIFTVRIEDGHPVETVHGPACVAVTGYTPEEFASDPHLWIRMVHEEDRGAVQEQARRVLLGQGVQPIEHRILRKGGVMRWVRNTPVPHYDRQGRLLSSDGLIQDITSRKRAEEALRESEKSWRDSFNSLDDIMLIVNKDYTIEKINSKGLELFGKIEEEVIGEKCYRVIHGVDKPGEFCPFRETLETGKPASAVDRYEEAFNKYFSIKSFPIVNEVGETVGFVDLMTDITEKKRTEEARRESEEKYKTLVESSLTGIFIHQDGKYVFVNDRFAEIHSYKSEELLGKEYLTLIHPDERETAAQIVSKRLNGEAVPERYEVQRLRKDGKTIWCEMMATRTEYGGRPAITGNIIEITKRKRAEEALRKSEQEKEAILNSMSEVVVYHDMEHRMVWANRVAGESVGLAPEELVGCNCYEIWHQRSKPCSGCPVVKTYETGQPQEAEMTTPDGRVWFVRGYPVRDANDNIAGVVEVTLEITERKRAEEEKKELEAQLRQAQKMEAIGTLAGGIAHDFNNILGAIMGYTQLAQLHAGDPSLKADLDEVLRAANRAKDLVQQILTFSRQSEQEFKPVQGNIVVKEALKFLRASLPTTIEIQQDIESDALVMGDPTQIHQVLMNLCTNAGHAMRERGGLLDVSLVSVELDSDFVARRPDMKTGPYLQLTVTDTGHGMPPEVLDRIFDPFFTTKEKAEGTGMGLSVVHGIVKSHGGTIYAYSEPGKGSSFKVYFPAIERRLEPEKREEEAILKGTERVLFIDDEQALVNVGRQLLETLGYKVTTRTSSTEALELFKSRPDGFDIVITDQTMPNMTGDELANELIAVRSDIPVILCTGFSTRTREDKAHEMGIRGFVMKPLVLRDLAKTIRKVLGEKLSNGSEAILLVDDSDTIIHVGSQRLRTLGYEVLIARSGKEAIEVYKKNQNRISMVILDVIMPDMGGGEAYDRMKEINPNVKVLLSSGYSIDSQAKEILKRGCDAFIQKPFDIEKLSQAIKEVLGKE